MPINFPNTAVNGEKYTAENGVEYTYNSNQDSWTGAITFGPKPIEPIPGQVFAQPDFGNPAGTNGGTGTQADPYVLQTVTVMDKGGTAQSVNLITIDNGLFGDLVIFTNLTTPTGIAPKFTQTVGQVDQQGNWQGHLKYDDSLGDPSNDDITYTGLFQIGTVFFTWQVIQSVTQDMVVVADATITADSQPVMNVADNKLVASPPLITGGRVPYNYAYKWESSDTGNDDDFTTPTALSGITTNTLPLGEDTPAGFFYRCIVTVTDTPTLELQTVTSASNPINVVNFTVNAGATTVVVGDTLDASYVITGNRVGYNVEENAYQWFRGDDLTPIIGETSSSYTATSADAKSSLGVSATASSGGAIDITNVSQFTLPVVEKQFVDQPTLISPPDGADGQGTFTPVTSAINTVVNGTITFTGTESFDYLKTGDTITVLTHDGSKEWSDLTTQDAVSNSFRSAENAFRIIPVLGSWNPDPTNEIPNPTGKFTPAATDFPNARNVFIMYRWETPDDKTGGYIKVNGNDVTLTDHELDETDGVRVELDSAGFDELEFAYPVTIAAIYVDHVLLVDASGIGSNDPNPVGTLTSDPDVETQSFTVDDGGTGWASPQIAVQYKGCKAKGDDITNPFGAPDADDLTMTATAFSGGGNPEPVFALSTWQIAFEGDTSFASPVVDVINTNETSFKVEGAGAQVPTTGTITTITPGQIPPNWDTSEVWSANATGTRPGYGPENIFNGNTTSWAFGGIPGTQFAGDPEILVPFPSPVMGVTDLRIWAGFDASGMAAGYLKINEVSITYFTTDNNWNIVTDPPSTFSSISYGNATTPGSNYVGVSAVQYKTAASDEWIWMINEGTTNGPAVRVEFGNDTGLSKFNDDDLVKISDDQNINGTAFNIDVAGKFMEILPIAGTWDDSLQNKTISGPPNNEPFQNITSNITAVSIPGYDVSMDWWQSFTRGGWNSGPWSAGDYLGSSYGPQCTWDNNAGSYGQNWDANFAAGQSAPYQTAYLRYFTEDNGGKYPAGTYKIKMGASSTNQNVSVNNYTIDFGGEIQNFDMSYAIQGVYITAENTLTKNQDFDYFAIQTAFNNNGNAGSGALYIYYNDNFCLGGEIPWNVGWQATLQFEDATGLSDFQPLDIVTLDYDNSEIWSQGGSDGQLITNSSWTTAFDGIFPEINYSQTAAYCNSDAVYRFPNGKTFTGFVEFYCCSGDNTNGLATWEIVLNSASGASKTLTGANGAYDPYWLGVNITDCDGFTLKQGNNGTQVSAVRINGKLLVDRGVTYTPPTGQIQSVNLGNNTMVVQPSNTLWCRRNVVGNRLMGDVVSPTSPLTEGTKYIARMRHTSSDNTNSEWSSTNSFETAPTTSTSSDTTLFYDANENKSIDAATLQNKYGLPARVDRFRGIYGLTYQPVGSVAGYEYDKVQDKYRPLPDESAFISTLQDKLVGAGTEWAPNTAYTQGDIVFYKLGVYTANVTATSDATFDSNDFTLIPGFQHATPAPEIPASTNLASLGDNPTPTPTPTPTPSPTPTPTPTPASGTLLVVTVVPVYGEGNRYYIDGAKQPTLSFAEGSTYKLDQSFNENTTHPIRISTTSDGTHNGGTEYTTGVTYFGTPGTNGAYTEITVPVGAPTLYYYCANHPGMGGQINTPAS